MNLHLMKCSMMWHHILLHDTSCDVLEVFVRFIENLRALRLMSLHALFKRSPQQPSKIKICKFNIYKTRYLGSVPDSGSNNNNSTGVSLSEILFSFTLEKHIVCDACGLKSPLFASSSVLYYTYLDLFHAGIDNARNATKIRQVLLLI